MSTELSTEQQALPQPQRRFAIIMAGGRGVRFWPRSRRALPKQCLSVDGGPTLIAQTHARMRSLVPAEDILVITGPDMVEAVRAALPALPVENLIVEPSARNTAPCVGLGVVEAVRRAGGEGALVLCVPADHVIRRPDALAVALEAAADAAIATGALVTLGIQPDRPETGYGYLELGSMEANYREQPVYRVACFREKPDGYTAAAYVQGGRHLWNAGMFVFVARDMLAAFRAHLPRSGAVLDRLVEDPGLTAVLWGELDATSLDYGIMERSANLLTVPCEPGWSDVGSWAAAAEVLPAVDGPGGHHAWVEALVSEGGAARCVVYAPGKVVALLGVEDLVVVDAADALLVCRREDAQDVRRIVSALEARGLEHLT